MSREEGQIQGASSSRDQSRKQKQVVQEQQPFTTWPINPSIPHVSIHGQQQSPIWPSPHMGSTMFSQNAPWMYQNQPLMNLFQNQQFINSPENQQFGNFSQFGQFRENNSSGTQSPSHTRSPSEPPNPVGSPSPSIQATQPSQEGIERQTTSGKKVIEPVGMTG